MRAVARDYGVSLATVQLWVSRAEDRRLDRVNFSDRADGPRISHNRTRRSMENLLLQTRQHLRSESPLGEYGAQAVREALLEQGIADVPGARTIGRIFARSGALDRRDKPRRKAPPLGWYLPDVACGACEVDSFDLVEGLKIKDGPLVEVFNGVSLHGGLVGSWPQQASIKATDVVICLVEHWQAHGLPTFAQFDNDTLFQGPHQHRDVIGRAMRLCLSLGVTPVFAPVAEQGFQAAIEGYNGLWQAKVWARFRHGSLDELQERSRAYVAAHRSRTASRRESAPARRAFPPNWSLDLNRHPADYAQARLVYVRRTSAVGAVTLLGRTVEVDACWGHRLVRCEVLLNEGVIRFYRLRRRAPQEQPLLREQPYQLPRRDFSE